MRTVPPRTLSVAMHVPPTPYGRDDLHCIVNLFLRLYMSLALDHAYFSVRPNQSPETQSLAASIEATATRMKRESSR